MPSSVRPTFSIIVPTRDRPEFLREALASIVAQSFSDFEVIVIDDGSRSDMQVPDDERIRLLRHRESLGPAAARNTGLRAARGVYVGFCDDDDMFTPTTLEMAQRGLSVAPASVCMVAHMSSPTEGGGRPLEGYVYDCILEGATPSLGATMVERAVCPTFREDLDNGEDIDWWLRLARDVSVAFVSEIGYLVRIHNKPRHRTDSLSRAEDHQRLLTIHESYFKAHPKAKAYRLRMVGLYYYRAGARGKAVLHMLKSLRTRITVGALRSLARVLIG